MEMKKVQITSNAKPDREENNLRLEKNDVTHDTGVTSNETKGCSGNVTKNSNVTDVTRRGLHPQLPEIKVEKRPCFVVYEHWVKIKGSAGGLLRAGGQMMRQAIADPTGSLDTVRSTVDSITRAVAVPDAALSPVWSERGTTYHFGAFEFPFDGLKQAAKTRGVRGNDAVRAAVASALDQYHERHGYEVPQLRVNVPISLRGDAGDRSAQASNAASIARLEMPVAGLSIDERMAEAHELVDDWRGAPATRMADPLADVSWFVPVPVLAQAARASDLTTSNVPGPPIPLYLAGAKMVAAFPLVATIGAAVNVTMVTYDGAACIGVSTDDRSVTDPAELIDDLRWGFEQVTGEGVEPADRYAARQPKGDTPAD